MADQKDVLGKVLVRLNERVKELQCIYRLEELLHESDINHEKVFYALLDILPPGWQYPTVCEVRVRFEDKEFTRPDFEETPWFIRSDIIIDSHILGSIEVFYSQLIREIDGSQFLPEEQKLLNTVTDRISSFIFFRRLRTTLNYLKTNGAQPLSDEDVRDFLPLTSDEHWQWRLRMAQVLADILDFEAYGVRGLYIIGSTKNALAGPGSDIDLIAHFQGDIQQRRELTAWIEGWGYALSEMNFMKTGYKSGNLIDLHLVTDEDIKSKNSYAIMIGASTDGARPLRVI